MLTREEAKEKVCPIKLTITPAVSYEMILCTAENCPKWRDSEDVNMWCQHIDVDSDNGFTEKFLGAGDITSIHICIPDDIIHCCKMYKNLREETKEGEVLYFDTVLDLKTCEKKQCNKCPHRFGYCGG